jgi:hypothetical protein
MAEVLVRDLDSATIKKLKQRARESGRSLQSELKLILEDAARMTLSEFHVAAEAIRNSLAGRTFSDSTELIREDRDR